MRAEVQRIHCVNDTTWSLLEKMLKLIDVLCERCKLCRPMSLPIYVGCGKLDVAYPLEYYVDGEELEQILESILAEKCDDFKRILEGEREYQILVHNNVVTIIRQEARPIVVEVNLGREPVVVKYAQLDFTIPIHLRRKVALRR